MIVEKVMSTNIISLNVSDTIRDAIALIKQHKIRHIPITDGSGGLAGLVSDRDIRDASPSIFRSAEDAEDLLQPIGSIMKTDLITGHPLDFVEEIGAVFCERNISCLPIVKNGKLVGIITGTDLLRSYVELTGVNRPGSQIEVRVPDRPGALQDVLAIIGKRKANIHSVLVYPDKEEESHKILVLRVQTMNPFHAAGELEAGGYTVLWPALPGSML